MCIYIYRERDVYVSQAAETEAPARTLEALLMPMTINLTSNISQLLITDII